MNTYQKGWGQFWIGIAVIVVAGLAAAMLSGCQRADEVRPAPARATQAQIAARAANSITFDRNAEIENINRRVKMTANPGQIGYVVLFNGTGQPIAYYGVRGKITSGSKRLTNVTAWVDRDCGEYRCQGSEPAPSDEGTYGSSGEYVFFWTTDDQYIQWNGDYLYSDKPFRTRIEPIVVSVQ